MADDDLLPPAPTPAPPTRPVTRDPVVCGFCESRLTARGEVLRLSDRAKALRDFEDDIEDVKRDLADAQAKVAQLERQNAELQAELTPKTARNWP